MGSDRDFAEWMSHFTDSISTYDYYVNFEKVMENAKSLKVELNILNTLIHSTSIESDFKDLVKEYPKTLKCIPILLAVRGEEIKARDQDGQHCYNFSKMNQSIDQYIIFMRKTGLFDMMSRGVTKDLNDYVLGVETGLDSNGRKNRGGHLMEDLVESYIKDLESKTPGLRHEKEWYIPQIENEWNLDLSSISNMGESTKRFDFVVEYKSEVYAFEVNFYASSGSKLNETARSYKMIAEEAKSIPHFHFVWVTDGMGWKAARNNLKETFDVLDNMYCLNDLNNGALKKMIVG